MARLIGRLERVASRTREPVRDVLVTVRAYDHATKTYTVEHRGVTIARVPSVGALVIPPGRTGRMTVFGAVPTGVVPTGILGL